MNLQPSMGILQTDALDHHTVSTALYNTLVYVYVPHYQRNTQVLPKKEEPDWSSWISVEICFLRLLSVEPFDKISLNLSRNNMNFLLIQSFLSSSGNLSISSFRSHDLPTWELLKSSMTLWIWSAWTRMATELVFQPTVNWSDPHV